MVNCPRCGEPVEWTDANRFRPFCSERCKMIDLGAWATESYRLPVKDDEADPGAADDTAAQRDKR